MSIRPFFQDPGPGVCLAGATASMMAALAMTAAEMHRLPQRHFL
jgi:hypothetical protein